MIVDVSDISDYINEDFGRISSPFFCSGSARHGYPFLSIPIYSRNNKNNSFVHLFLGIDTEVEFRYKK